MRGCSVCNGDDGIAVATYDPSAHSGNVLVEGCYFCNGSHGASIGSRDLGGVHNVTVMDSVFVGTENAVRVKAVAGSPGSVSDIVYSNITAVDVGHVLMIDALYHEAEGQAQHAKSESDVHVSGHDARAVAETEMQAVITRVSFRNIIGRGAGDAGYFKCQPSSPCTHVELMHIDIQLKGGHAAEFQCESAHGTSGENVVPRSCLLPGEYLLSPLRAPKKTRFPPKNTRTNIGFVFSTMFFFFWPDLKCRMCLQGRPDSSAAGCDTCDL